MEPVDDGNREAGQAIQPDVAGADKAGILLEREEVQCNCVGYEKGRCKSFGGSRGDQEGQPSYFLHRAWTEAEHWN